MADPIMDLFEDTPLFNLDAISDDSFTQGSSDPVEEALKLALGQVDPPTEPELTPELTVNTGLCIPAADPAPIQMPTPQPVPVATAQMVSLAPAPATIETVPQIDPGPDHVSHWQQHQWGHR